jgi:hypothetical protein
LRWWAIAQVFGIGLLGWTWSVGQTYVAELFPTEVRVAFLIGPETRGRSLAELDAVS